MRRDGIWAGAEEKPWGAQKSLGGAAALPAPQGKVLNTCKDGGQNFLERGLLIVHVLRTHLGECNLPCGECGKILSGWGRLAAHQRAHLWDRTFTRVACTRSIVYSEHLVDKVRMELAGAKPFKCTKCSDRIILMVEPPAERGRGSFPCPHCPQVFPDVYLLQCHPLRHAGEASFPCAKCGKSLQRRIALGKHHRRPSAEQPGPCAERTRQERRESHAPEQPFPGAQSGGHVPRRGSLTAHLRARHRTSAPSAASASAASGRCLRPAGPRAGQASGSREAWATHRLEQEHQKLFTCAECGKGLRRTDSGCVRAPRLPPVWPALPPAAAAGTAPVPPPGAKRAGPRRRAGPHAWPCHPFHGRSWARHLTSLGRGVPTCKIG
ncbi:unnamed protein product [Natator depressus]